MNLWEELLARIETKVNRHSYHTWFRPISFVSEDRSSLTIRVPDPSFEEWLPKHYGAVIGEALKEVNRPNLALQFVTDSSDR